MICTNFIRAPDQNFTSEQSKSYTTAAPMCYLRIHCGRELKEDTGGCLRFRRWLVVEIGHLSTIIARQQCNCSQLFRLLSGLQNANETGRIAHISSNYLKTTYNLSTKAPRTGTGTSSERPMAWWEAIRRSVVPQRKLTSLRRCVIGS